MSNDCKELLLGNLKTVFIKLFVFSIPVAIEILKTRLLLQRIVKLNSLKTFIPFG